MLRKTLFGLVAGASALACAAPAQAQDYYLGQIVLFPYTFCPRGTAEASGSLLSIAQNNALFALFGTTYGGDGINTFALPDLRGRGPLHTGQGPGLASYVMGQQGGVESTTLTMQQMASHTHVGFARAVAGAADTNDPPNASPADFPAGNNVYNNNTPPNINMAAGTASLLPQGGNQPFSNLRPFLAMRYCVFLQGIFPPQP